MDPQFRTAGTGDLEVVLELMRAHYAYDGHEFREDRLRPAAEGLLEDPTAGRIYLIEAAGKAVGYAAVTFGYSLEFGGRDAFLDEFFLSAARRGRGWGRLALEHVEREARALGVQALHVQVVRGNDCAERLYRSAGFTAYDRLFFSKELSRDR